MISSQTTEGQARENTGNGWQSYEGQVFEKQGEGKVLRSGAVKQRSTTPGAKHSYGVPFSIQLGNWV